MTSIIEKDREQYRKIFGERDKQKEYWAYTNCAACYEECPVKVKVVNGLPVQVEGNPDSPRGTQGGMCAKGISSLLDWYNPNRILYPVKRTNPKKGLYEDPKWERITWEEALDTIGEKLKAAWEKDPRTVFNSLTPGPNGGTRAGITFSRWLPGFGTTSRADGGAGVMCGAAAHHFGALHHAAWDIIPDYKYCNYILRCGGAEGWGGGRKSSHTIKLAAEARERGMKMVVLDPQGFTVASKGGEWIPILPAMDVAVFMALINIILNDIGIYDKEYIRHKTNGPYLVGPDMLWVRNKETGEPQMFDEADQKIKTWDDPTLTSPAIEGSYTVEGVEAKPSFALIKEHVKQYSSKWAEKLSTVPAATIERIAKELVEEAKIGSFIEIDGVKVAYRPVAIAGYKGLQTHSNAFHQYSAMCLLNAILGTQDCCGGLLGSGTANSFGETYPNWKFFPFEAEEGMLQVGPWTLEHAAWPPRPVMKPGTMHNFQDFLANSSSNPNPYTEDWEELWDNIGRPFEPEVFMVYGSNAVMNVARPETAAKWIKKIPFTFCMQPTHNETSEGFADIVLPVTDSFEALDADSGFGATYNAPYGLEDWCMNIRMPVVEPRGETRDITDIMFDLAERVDPKVVDGYNKYMDDTFTFRGSNECMRPGGEKIPPIVGPGERVTNMEFVQRTLNYHFGEEHDLAWFRDHGTLKWKKNVGEAYWRWNIKGRVPIYYEHVQAMMPKTIEAAKSIGFELKNWDILTGMTSYFQSNIYDEPCDPNEFDLITVSPHESFIMSRYSPHNPHINEVCERNPYTYNINMNLDTGKKKGIKDGDIICLENRFGDKIEGRVKLTELVHPQIVAAVGLGSWAKGKPIAKGKGVNINALIRSDKNHFCPLTGSAEPCVRVKAYKKK